MIVRLNKEQQRTARRQLIGDDVYVLCHDVLKQMMNDGHTELSPVEVFLSAQLFCKTILSLPNPIEGLDDEIDDLEEVSQGNSDALLILAVTTAQMQAVSKQYPDVDIRGIVYCIYERLDNNELLLPILDEMAKKEDVRRMEGKKINLLDYEMKEINLEGGGTSGIKHLFENFATYSDKLDAESIKGQLLILNRYNIDHNHAYDNEIISLYDKLGIKSMMINEFVNTKYVENEFHKIENGGTGVKKEYHKD